jgi:hypothetical protein
MYDTIDVQDLWAINQNLNLLDTDNFPVDLASSSTTVFSGARSCVLTVISITEGCRMAADG